MVRTAAGVGRGRHARMIPRPLAAAESAASTSAGAGAVIGAVFANTALFTGIMYLFGRTRTAATARYFGVDISQLSLSTPEYLLRGLDSTFNFLVPVMVALLAANMAHHRLRTATLNPARKKHVLKALLAIRGAAFVGMVITAVAVAVRTDHIVFTSTSPLVGMLACAVIFAYSDRLVAATKPTAGKGIRLFLLVSLVSLSLVESVTTYAKHVGERAAISSEKALREWPELIMYSTEKIGVNGTGVVFETSPDTTTKYRYRYSGLRLLLRTGKDQLLVVPSGWRRGQDRAILIKEDEKIRIEMVSPP